MDVELNTFLHLKTRQETIHQEEGFHISFHSQVFTLRKHIHEGLEN